MMPNNYDDSIRLEAAGLQQNQTMSMECPECHGGAHRDRCFYVTRKGSKLLYICHRASCGLVPGAIDDVISEHSEYRPSREHVQGAVKTTPNLPGWLKPSYPLSDADISYFRERFNIRPTISAAHIRSTDNGYLFPVYSFGKLTGHVERRKPWSGIEAPAKFIVGPGPKVKAWPVVAPMPLATADHDFCLRTERIILVEDMLSQIRVMDALKDLDYDLFDVQCLSILGSSLSYFHLHELQQKYQARQVILALDPDMWKKSLSMAMEYSCLFPDGMQTCLLNTDPKDFIGPKIDYGSMARTSIRNQQLLEALRIE